MRYSLVTLFLVLCLGAVFSVVVAPFFQDDIGPDIKYLDSQGFGFHSFKDSEGLTYLTSIGARDRVIQDFDAIVIGKQTRIGLLDLSRSAFNDKQFQEMLQPEISHLVLDGVTLRSGLLPTIYEKKSLLALDLSCMYLGMGELTRICALPNLCLLRLTDVRASLRQSLPRLALRNPQIKIYCNAETLPLPDEESK